MNPLKSAMLIVLLPMAWAAVSLAGTRRSLLWGALTWLPLLPLGWFAWRGQWMGFVAAVILAVVVWSRVKKEPARSK